MGTLNEDLTEIKSVEDALTSNKVARFAYTENAYNNNDADGVDVYNVDNEQNIPNGTASIMKVNQTVINKGYRAQASSITRMLMNHFLGRLSYNVNKVNDNMSSLLSTLQSHLGTSNGIATLDADGRVPYSQLPESAMEYKGTWNASTNTPTLADGTGNTGDMYMVSVEGTVDFGSGDITLYEGDSVVYNGSVWQRVSGGKEAQHAIEADTATLATLATLATQALAIKPLGNSITLPATPTSVTKIIKIATVDYKVAGNIKISTFGIGIACNINLYFGQLGDIPGLQVTYTKEFATYGIKKIIVTQNGEEGGAPRNIYAEIVNYPNNSTTTTIGVVETETGTFTPSMTEVSNVEGTVLDSLPLDYVRGDISSFQHEFTKSPIAPTPATATNNTQIATTAFVKNQKYEPNRGTGTASLALGVSANARGESSIALGANATAYRDYQITIGTKFVYLRFSSTETEATVYTVLSPWLSPLVGGSQSAMGHFGTSLVTLLKREGSNSITMYSGFTKPINAGNSAQIGSDLAICTVKY